MSEQKEKYYKVPEKELVDLLEAWHKLSVLECDGVDNWTWYMEGRKDYLRNYEVTEEEIEDGFDFGDLAYRELKIYEVVE